MNNVNRVFDKDNREYFRIDDIAILSYRTVSQEEVRSAQNLDPGVRIHTYAFKAKLDRLSRELQPLYNVIKSSDTNIAMYLATLNKKIDLLSERMIEDEEADNSMEAQKINIGAGGLAFISDKPFVPGALLEMQMKLLPEIQFIFSYASIISCKRLDNSAEQQKYKIAVEFEFMDDDIRDLITRHVLSKEREYLNSL